MGHERPYRLVIPTELYPNERALEEKHEMAESAKSRLPRCKKKGPPAACFISAGDHPFRLFVERLMGLG